MVRTSLGPNEEHVHTQLTNVDLAMADARDLTDLTEVRVCREVLYRVE